MKNHDNLSIAIVIHTFNNQKSGKEIFNWILVKHLANRGHQIHVVSANFKELSHENIVFHSVSMKGKAIGIHRWWFAKSARRKVDELDVDLVFTNGKSIFGDVVRVGGIYRSYLERMFDSKVSPISKFFYKLSKKCSISSLLSQYLESKTFQNKDLEKLIVNTKTLKRNVLKHYQSLESDEVEVIYNGVDLEQYNYRDRDQYRQETRNELGIEDETTVVLFVGNEFSRKGLDYFLDLVRKHSEWEGIVIGDDSLPPLKTDLADRIHWLGSVENVAPFYASSEALVLPSLSDGFSLVVLEALAMGTYVCVSDNCGAKEIIHDIEIGHVFSLDEDPVPSDFINYSFEESLIKKRAEFASRFSWEKCVDQYEKSLFKTLS